MDALVRQIASEFDLNDEQAFEAVDSVLRITREASGAYVWTRFSGYLPAEMTEAIR